MPPRVSDSHINEHSAVPTSAPLSYRANVASGGACGRLEDQEELRASEKEGRKGWRRGAVYAMRGRREASRALRAIKARARIEPVACRRCFPLLSLFAETPPRRRAAAANHPAAKR